MKRGKAVLLAGLLFVPCMVYAKKHHGYPTYRVGGQVVLDTAWFLYDRQNENDQEIRRGRLFLKGELWKHLSYEMEYSISGGEWKDLYLRYQFNELSAVTAGNIKEPFGFEALSSSKYNTFMERALPDIFISSRKVGILAEYGISRKKSWVWRVSGGLYAQPIEAFDLHEDHYTVAGKTTFAQIFGKKHLLHTGISAAYTHLNDTKLKLSTRPETHLSETRYLKTKIKHTESTGRYGIEGYYQYRGFSLQGEYMTMRLETQKRDYDFSGWYLQTGYFLTGDAKRYKTKDGVLGRLSPKHPVTKGGAGAVEVACRISALDFQEKLENAGDMKSYTIGLNWYMTAQLRMMFNMVKIDTENKAGRENPDILEMRVQYDF